MAREIAVASPLPRAAAQDLTWPLLVAGAAAAAVVPLWSSEVLPFQDAPQHLASIRILADYHTASFGFERWFEIDLARLQYLGFYLPAAALAKLVGPDQACRIVLSVVAFALPASFWMLLGAFGRDRRLAVFAPPIFHTMPLYMGFFNFVESVPAAVALVALTEGQLREPSCRRGVAIGAGGAILLWLHPSALAFALACAVTLALTSGLPSRRMRSALWPYVPAALLFMAWAVQAALSRDGAGQHAHTPPRWLPLQVRVMDILRFGNVMGGRADEVFAVLLVALFGAVALLRPRPEAARSFRVPLLAALTFAAYFAAPFDIGYMGYIEQRALPFLALLVIASPVTARTRAAGLLCGAAVALQVAYAGALAEGYRAFDREAQIDSLSQVLRAAEPGKRLIALVPEQGSHVMQFQLYMHFAAYYEIQRGGRARYNFAETPWTPVRFRRGTEPPLMPQAWELHPEWVSLDRDAPQEEYLLLRTPAFEPPPRFHLLSREGRWALYETSRR
jgi:hypothetical protein